MDMTDEAAMGAISAGAARAARRERKRMVKELQEGLCISSRSISKRCWIAARKGARLARQKLTGRKGSKGNVTKACLAAGRAAAGLVSAKRDELKATHCPANADAGGEDDKKPQLADECGAELNGMLAAESLLALADASKAAYLANKVLQMARAVAKRRITNASSMHGGAILSPGLVQEALKSVELAAVREVAPEGEDVSVRNRIRVIHCTQEEAAIAIQKGRIGGLHRRGWCLLSDRTLNKANGYVSASVINAASKPQSLVGHHVVQIANGQTDLVADKTLESSHLCSNSRCMLIDHIRSESKTANNLRKGCVGWIPCPHCPVPFFLCQHDPPCVRFHPSYDNMDELRLASNGAKGHLAAFSRLPPPRNGKIDTNPLRWCPSLQAS